MLLASLIVVTLSGLAHAHFVLLEPASWLVENRLGDPQKLGPCGGTSADSGTPTNVIGKVRGGDKVHLKVQETIYHPGHYRVALAVNSRAELPPDPDVTTRETEKGPWSVSAVIQNPPQVPVLADGLFVHMARPAEPFETDIQLPNITCEKCTLQIVQFMAEHGLNKDGGYTYHHCADLQITADPGKPIDTRWSARR
jgi:hypothetical protein